MREDTMRLAIACFAGAVVLSGCASTNDSQTALSGSLPPDVGNGIGSQYGNYEMRPAGETHDSAGDRCVIFNWDRPLNKDFVIRYTSASCESKEHPVWMTTTKYTREVIPISQSSLKDAEGQTGP
jgi:hypothetical protein